MPPILTDNLRRALLAGQVIPAHPLALDANRKLDERRQRALSRYYLAAGAGGLAVGVHTTQFAIRDARVGLYKPVLELAAEEMAKADETRETPIIRVAGICGPTAQAVQEAETAAVLGYHLGLLSLAALPDAPDAELLDHCRAVAGVIPLFGFYLQPAVGGRVLSRAFWRAFAEIEGVMAIKIAPFNRYQTLDVVQAVAEADRDGIALYTGNDDNIIADLLTPFRVLHGEGCRDMRIVGGLLGQWAVWTHQAVLTLAGCQEIAEARAPIPREMLRTNAEMTLANAAIFDAANGFRGCIAGIHEVLRRQGLLEGIWCLDPEEGLSPGQAEAIERICRAYPHLTDDEFVEEHRDAWLTP
jgi:hypothetical protein